MDPVKLIREPQFRDSCGLALVHTGCDIRRKLSLTCRRNKQIKTFLNYYGTRLNGKKLELPVLDLAIVTWYSEYGVIHVRGLRKQKISYLVDEKKKNKFGYRLEINYTPATFRLIFTDKKTYRLNLQVFFWRKTVPMKFTNEKGITGQIHNHLT